MIWQYIYNSMRQIYQL